MSGDPSTRGRAGATAPSRAPHASSDPAPSTPKLRLVSPPVSHDPAPDGAGSREVRSGAGRRAELRLPAHNSSLRLARLVVSGVAADASFTVDEVEDLRIAVDEACAAFLPGDHDVAGELVVEVDLQVGSDRAGNTLLVRVSSLPRSDAVIDPVPALLLDHTTDGWSVVDGAVELHRTGAVPR